MKKALIIFVKNLRYGKVKTRLAATMGNEKAYEIYNQLLQHTSRISERVQADKYVFYSEAIEQDTIWNPREFKKKLQGGLDLGTRMRRAFDEIFSKGYNQVCIIGSDCLELTDSIIEKAFSAMGNSDIVIGPATDGGYYLLGMKQMNTVLFHNIDWSTAKVFQQTINACTVENLKYTILPQLDDIDNEKDWLRAVRTLNL